MREVYVRFIQIFGGGESLAVDGKTADWTRRALSGHVLTPCNLGMRFISLNTMNFCKRRARHGRGLSFPASLLAVES